MKLALVPLVFLLSSCAIINQPRCRDHHVTGFEPWQHQGQWQTDNNTTLPYSTWPDTPPKHPNAVVIMVQGWDATGRDYDSIGRRLAREGYAVYASENRCGRYDSNINRRGSAPKSGDIWVEDLKKFTAFVRKRHPHTPFFYHGHSLGCLVAIEAVVQADEANKPQGLILHSPGFPLMSKRKRPILTAISFPFSWVRLPQLLVINPKKNGPYGDPETNCRWLKSSDRVKRGYQLGFLLKAVALGHEARLDSRTLELPVLSLGGGKDWICSLTPHQQRAYIKYLSMEIAGGQEQAGGHTRFHFYPDGYHILTEPPTKEDALDEIVAWLDRHRPGL